MDGMPVIAEQLGEALPIVLSLDNHKFSLNEDALKQVLLHPKVKDRKVVVLSVAGAYRKGKSFLLDFFLRYLYAEGGKNWIGNPNDPLKGFPWKGGSERQTSGILLWSEPFEVSLPNGEKASVLIMDTQGAFDSQSTVKDCATVFALSTLLSSVQVYNITANLQEDDLQHLQLFTEYGRLAMENNSLSKPFQYLNFLIRDWSYPYQHSYGTVGGNELLEKRLEVIDGQHVELQQIRQYLRMCFNKIDCFLMPHPGLTVATSPKFDGRLEDIEEDFTENIQVFISSLLSTNNLVVKEINGSQITGKELIEYFKAYVNMYQSDELPHPKSMLQATAEANNLAAVAKAKDAYVKAMEEVCGGDKPYLTPSSLAIEHDRCLTSAHRLFSSVPKMGGEVFSNEYLERLNTEIEIVYDSYMRHNTAKNVFTGMRTPVVLAGFAVALYVISGILGMLGLLTLANLINLALIFIVAVSAFWMYARFTGTYADTAAHIDTVADAIHRFVHPGSREPDGKQDTGKKDN